MRAWVFDLRCCKVFSESQNHGRRPVPARQHVRAFNGHGSKEHEVFGNRLRNFVPQADLTKLLKSDVRYDLAISNLVFHNMGEERFKAYETVFDALKPRGCFIIGDLFPRGNADIDCFRERSTLINELDQGGSGRWDYKIKVLRKE